ncbi:serine protease [Streptomyces sp. P3]|uniref:trypsin-like serine peptidase n=1 Tax=Streptomyces sp. P3 TaxID=2135430 RepID=UPI000D19D031|nr:trypsin-like peptidase domain-containing protein [Streptomyces sp. P3]
MNRRTKALRSLATTSAIAGLITTTAVVDTASASAAGPTASRWTAAAAQQFWTNERMAEAKPFPDVSGMPSSPRTLSGRLKGGRLTSSPFGGLAMIGRMYMRRGSGSYFCTASVIKSPHHNIVLTAGHCLDAKTRSSSMAFVPQWTAANPRPHGIFPVRTDSANRSRIWIDQRYYDRGHIKGAPWDVAFVQVDARDDGQQVQDVVGGNTLATRRGYAFARVRLVGYPGADRQPLTCTNSTTRFTPTDHTPGSYLRIACNDYRPGTSGSPFLANFNTRTGTGEVVGSIGGWKTGGPTADVSYSPNFGPDVQHLYDAAVAGSPPARPRTLPGAPH